MITYLTLAQHQGYATQIKHLILDILPTVCSMCKNCKDQYISQDVVSKHNSLPGLAPSHSSFDAILTTAAGTDAPGNAALRCRESVITCTCDNVSPIAKVGRMPGKCAGCLLDGAGYGAVLASEGVRVPRESVSSGANGPQCHQERQQQGHQAALAQ